MPPPLFNASNAHFGKPFTSPSFELVHSLARPFRNKSAKSDVAFTPASRMGLVSCCIHSMVSCADLAIAAFILPVPVPCCNLPRNLGLVIPTLGESGSWNISAGGIFPVRPSNNSWLSIFDSFVICGNCTFGVGFELLNKWPGTSSLIFSIPRNSMLGSPPRWIWFKLPTYRFPNEWTH